jgi:hypothetical protein
LRLSNFEQPDKDYFFSTLLEPWAPEPLVSWGEILRPISLGQAAKLKVGLRSLVWQFLQIPNATFLSMLSFSGYFFL